MIDSLNQACTLGNPKLVNFLLKHMEHKYGGEGVTNLLSHEDDDQNTPLHVCVESGSYESAKVSIYAQEQLLKFCEKILIDNGANINTFNKDTMYPLHIACTVGSLDIVKVEKQSLEHKILKNFVQILIEHGATINILNNNFQTPLHLASSHNKRDIIEYLLKNGAAIERMDKDSQTPVLLASHLGRPQALKKLLE